MFIMHGLYVIFETENWNEMKNESECVTYV